MNTLWQDLRFGARMLRKNPGLTSVAVLSLALGIMATTAIYSVIHAVVLDPFPYKDVDNLMSVKVWDPNQRGFRLGYSTDQFLEIAERSAIFEGVIASTISDVLWSESGEPQRLRGNYGTFNTFQVMGVPPLVGRTTLPDDAKPDAEPVVVLGYRFWQRQFGGDPGVVGRELRLNDKVRTVIGVMPKRFMWRGADVYLPITFERGRVVEGVRGVHLLGRLKPGVTPAQAEVDLRPIIADLKKTEPAQFPDNWRVGLLSFKETFPSSIRENLWILFGAVGLLLLIACANVSNLLLAKASERQKETMRVPLPEQRYPDSERRVAFFQELLRRGSAVPGVEAVGLNSGVHPLGNMGAPVEVVGSTQQDTRPVVIHQINTDYTKALGIALVEGRLFAESEVYGKQQLAVVNRSFARSRLDGRDAPGRVIRVPRLKQPPFGVTDDSFQVVGVVKDRLNRGLTNEVTPEVYLPFTLTGRADRLVALAQADPASITKAVMSQVYSIDKDQPVTDVRTIDRVLQEGVYAGPRFNLALFAVFAALGLALAVIGVYGVMSSAVAQQTHEIGVRMALGATPGKVSGMVVKRGLWLLLAGIAVGLLGSFLTARLLAGQIWNVSPFDPVTFSAVSLILLVAGLQACVWPARRAARIDPIAALRQE
jgi:hypothetical protein